MALFIPISYNGHFGLSPLFQTKEKWLSYWTCELVACSMSICTNEQFEPETCRRGAKSVSVWERVPSRVNKGGNWTILFRWMCLLCFVFCIDRTITRITENIHIQSWMMVLIDDGFDRKSIPSHPTYWINNQFLVVLWHVLWNQMVADLDVHGIHINEHSSEVRLVVARLDFQGFTWGDFTNGGTPKWMAYKGKCIYKRMRTGVSPFLETPTCLTQDWWLFQCYSSCSFVLGYSMGDSNLG